ncbi:DUF2911 domain-containing protein [Ochrovirga pacifica]|uniref:DUF2911 domain-containing protein n=1 Tax=Ochrovirga pacifica TaxID=1042376 RepID=UPI000255A4FF|nr:DUF2911 domain-containing protein [Ochrovirga pacifica]
MKKVVLLWVFVMAICTVNAQKFRGLDKSPLDAVAYPVSYKNADKIVKVVYSRPQLKGRSVESLAKPGSVWRTGANEATEITFFKEVKVAGTKVQPGTYSLFTIPGSTSWTVILNKDTNVWGAYSYNQEHDVLRVEAVASKNEENVEAFSMAFDDDMNLYMAWGTTLVKLPMSK